jgi:hypothetical protein
MDAVEEVGLRPEPCAPEEFMGLPGHLLDRFRRIARKGDRRNRD